MDTKKADETLIKLQKFEAGLQSKYSDIIFDTLSDMRIFLEKSHDNIFITAVFLKIANLLEKVPLFVKNLLVNVFFYYKFLVSLLKKLGIYLMGLLIRMKL